MDYRKHLWSLLALTGLTTHSAAALSSQTGVQILKGEANRLTMKFRGQKPALVEVVVDGIVVATRHLSGQAEQVQFNLQNAGLAPGSHEATIRLYDAQGRLLGEQRTRLNLLPDPNSPLTILMPRNGSQVAGITPIEVRVPRQSGVYVSFFIDGQIRGLRNYPPYVYNWDTTRETNGWHTIEVWSYDGNQTLKTPPMRVYVNNPGGRTERQLPPEPERLSAEAEPAVAAAESAPAVSDGSMRVALAPESRLSERVRLSAPAAPSPAPAEPSVSPAIGEPTTAPTVNAPAAAHLSANRLSAPLDEPSLQAVQHAPMQAVHLARAVEAEPQMRGQKLRAPQVVSTPPAVPAKAPANNSAWLSLEPGVRLPASITQFEVTLDAALLSFDVAPRVEEGVALVPIRAVLEHLGASLRWDHQRKVVYATLNGRQITLRVRENAIQVDGAPVPAEASLRIVRGRVLVPATALRELLGAEVAFDLAAQQLVINTAQRERQ